MRSSIVWASARQCSILVACVASVLSIISSSVSVPYTLSVTSSWWHTSGLPSEPTCVVLATNTKFFPQKKGASHQPLANATPPNLRRLLVGYMQLFSPKVVATAVNTVIKNWMMLLHVFFFIAYRFFRLLIKLFWTISAGASARFTARA